MISVFVVAVELVEKWETPLSLSSFCKIQAAFSTFPSGFFAFFLFVVLLLGRPFVHLAGSPIIQTQMGPQLMVKPDRLVDGLAGLSFLVEPFPQGSAQRQAAGG